MQIILVSGRLKTAKTLTIMPRHVLLAVGCFVGLVIATSMAFSWATLNLRLPLIQELVLSLQQRETNRTQEFVRNNLQLMATRLGELQAQMLQLDSLGDRLYGLTGLKREKDGARDDLGKAGQGGPLIAAPLSATELQREIDRLATLVDGKTEELAVLEAKMLEKRVRDRLLPTTLPVKDAAIGSGFGHRSDPIVGVRAMHEGIDFVAETGTPVVAAAGGVVVSVEHHPEFGNMIDLDHGEGLTSRYAHLSKTLVQPGQVVQHGERIGEVGSTGRSTGSHLHFEVRMLGTAQDPAQFLKQGAEYAQVRRR